MNVWAQLSRRCSLVLIAAAVLLVCQASSQANEDRPPADVELSAPTDRAKPVEIPQATVAELNRLDQEADGALLDGEFERARDALIVLNALEAAYARPLGDAHRGGQKLRLDSLERMCGLPRAGRQRVRAAAICCAAGKACAEAGELQKAERQMTDGVEMFEQALGKQDWFCVRSRMLLGRIALEAGHPREAKQAFQQMLEAGPTLTDDSERAIVLDLLALAQGQLGEFTEGEQQMQASLALRERVLPLKHVDRVVMLTDYAWFCAMKEDWERSEAYAEQAIEKCRELRMPAEHPITVCAHERQARALVAQREFEKAEPVLRGIVAARQTTASPQGLCELLEMHAECLQQLQRTGEADRLRARIAKLRQAEARSPAGRG
ncbi:MAG TPA: hypothetical protein VHB77_08795 [Planctomycetaceae bacterium]|nr:hypothetical protein [Planctomycetaceae bacterium]